MAYCVDISDLAAGMNDSVVHLKFFPFARYSLEPFRCPRLILWMNALKECFESGQPTVRVKTVQAVAFLGPVPILARGGVPCPTAGMAEPLRFCQVCLALPKLHFRLLRRRDVCHGAYIFKVATRRLQRASKYVNVLDSTRRQ